MTPMNSTKNLKACACAMNQQATSNPTASRTVKMVSQSFLPHQRVNKKHTARTKLTTLLAMISNPQKMSSAPMSELPRYPAGRVMAEIPPRIIVTPPSRGSSLILSTRPPVQQAAITSILNGHSDQRRNGTFHRIAMATVYAAMTPSVTFCVSVTEREPGGRSRLLRADEVSIRWRAARGAAASAADRASFTVEARVSGVGAMMGIVL
ncbi:hypothetical protein PspLS_00211 [Pyricularia sp. CBS 133598]|nr:hypothetical protein PspLS_00211 [Pyricularia sp. CBS 133598]